MVLSEEEVGGRSVFHWVTPSETSLLTAKSLDPIAASLCSIPSRSFRVCEGYRAHDKGGNSVFFFETCWSDSYALSGFLLPLVASIVADTVRFSLLSLDVWLRIAS